jgi:RecA/RadA recombinase
VPSAWIPSLDLAAHLIPARQLEAREKRRRLATGLASLDELLGGGWACGALNELCGGRSSGRTSVLMTSLAAALHRGESAALIDVEGVLDPQTAARVGLPLSRLLWVRAVDERRDMLAHKALTAAQLVIGAGGFTLVTLDLGEARPRVPMAAWTRLKRSAGAQQTALLVATTHKLVGAQAMTSLSLRPLHPRMSADDPLLLGMDVSAQIERGDQESARPFTLAHSLCR